MISLLVIGVFYFSKNIQAQDSVDAIAIRIIPNPKHLSALSWYKSRGFMGSPQSVVVDGYLGVRDGRTVYINVANISSSNLYTNIYLISYNKNAGKDTTNIFSKILSHWKFNTNIASLGHCRGDFSMFCLNDDECPIGDNCDSLKARVIRDVDRMSDLANINKIIKDYYKDNGQYPVLSSGSYILYNTLSVWPSWNETLGKILGKKISVDPINALGDCGGDNFDKKTCWDNNAKRFSEILPNLPTNSLVYSYSTDSSGLIATSCAVMESGMNIQGDTVCSLDICLDFDGDGYGNPASLACLGPGSGLLDCNDLDDGVQSGSPENPGAGDCNDSIDNDCDGLIDCNDGDCASAANCATVPGCGNGTCDSGENCNSCPTDCGVCLCPNGVCDFSSGECVTCPGDCDGDSNCCGIDGCNTAIGECTSCPSDCDASDTSACCGDGVCDVLINENALNCPTDCACSDDDGDLYIAEAFAPGSCGNTCGHGPVFVACIGNNDCDDSIASGFPINPGADEICDGIDNDCDATTPDGVDEGPYLNSKQAGICAGTIQSCKGTLGWQDDYSSVTPPYESPEENCSDTIDNDCNFLTDAADPACAGTCFGIFSNENLWYIASEDPDCNQCDFAGDQDGDQAGSVQNWGMFPSQWADFCDDDCGGSGALVSVTVNVDDFELNNETKCDGIDNDCDGTIDEDLGQTTCGLGICNHTIDNCISGVLQICDPFEGAGVEICNNGIDEDCDGSDASCVFCYADTDGDGYGDPSDVITAPTVCPIGRVLDNTDCDDSLDWVKPGGTENCDGIDSDCDGSLDEDCDLDNDGYCDTSPLWFSTASCPDTSIPTNVDCDDNDSSINPGISPDGCDGVDNDCDGSIDEDANAETCQTTCESAGYTWLTTFCCGNDANEANPYQLPESNCSDFNDNDCDGDIDCDDSDCICPCTFDAKVPCSLL